MLGISVGYRWYSYGGDKYYRHVWCYGVVSQLRRLGKGEALVKTSRIGGVYIDSWHARNWIYAFWTIIWCYKISGCAIFVTYSC